MIKSKIYDILKGIIGTNYNKEYYEIVNLVNNKNLKEFQEKSLKKLLIHSYQNVPYYTHIFNEIDIIKNSDNCDLSKFNQIPILTKDIIKKNFYSLTSKDYLKRKWYYYGSGGTTGEPFTFIQDINYQRWDKATTKYYKKNIVGFNKNNPKNIYLWGSEKEIFSNLSNPKDIIQNWLNNSKILNSFNMTEENMEKYIKIINSFKPEYILGYPNSLNDLSRYIKENKYQIYSPKFIISSAEVLREDIRKTITEVFETKVLDFYGSRETASIAGECKKGAMHLFSFNNLIEILDENNQPVKNNQEGRVIITNLHNYSMPFIRYELGDTALFGDTNCECGNPLPTLKKITGRILEHFIRKDGSIVPAEFFMFLFIEYHKNGRIKKYQIIQETYKKIKILLVLDGKISEKEKEDIEDKIRIAMNSDIEIVWEFVTDISKTQSGKYLYTQSKISKKL